MKIKKKMINKKIIVLSAISLIIVCSIGYFVFKILTRDHNFLHKAGNFNISDRGRDFPRNTSPLDEGTKNQITSFFGNSSSLSEIEDYCNKNPSYCVYYCREMKPDSEICSQIMNFTRLPNGGQPLQ